MLHLLIVGLLLGWGAAVPIGPMNLEIIRRNLRIGTSSGVVFGLGACSADILYLILLAAGALMILQHPTLLAGIGLIGSCVLAWFGVSALRMKAPKETTEPISDKASNLHLSGQYLQGLLLTLTNPNTILFWSSVASQIAHQQQASHASSAWMGAGVAIGVLSWALGLNAFLHFTRHKLPDKTMHYLNVMGGCLLLAFAAYGFYHFSFFLLTT